MPVTNPIVSSIEGYVEQHKSELLSKTLLDGKSRGLFNLMTDVKGPTTLNIIDSEIHFQPLACSWTNSGTTTYSQRTLTPCAIQAQTDFCSVNLLKTYAQHEVKVAAGRENLPFEEKWIEGLVGNINEQIEKMIYQGQSGQTNQFEGLVSILENDANAVAVSAAQGTTAYAFLKDVAKSIPVNVKNPVILVSTALYREYMQDLVAANLFHYDPANGENEYRLPGTDIRVIAVDGLNGMAKDYAIAANLNNIYFGVSADEDIDTFDVYFDRGTKSFRFDWAAIMGVQIAFPDECVLGSRG